MSTLIYISALIEITLHSGTKVASLKYEHFMTTKPRQTAFLKVTHSKKGSLFTEQRFHSLQAWCKKGDVAD